MPLLEIIIIIALIGFLLYLANTFLPMQSSVKQIFNIVVVLVLIIWLLRVFGVFHYLGAVHV